MNSTQHPRTHARALTFKQKHTVGQSPAGSRWLLPVRLICEGGQLSDAWRFSPFYSSINVLTLGFWWFHLWTDTKPDKIIQIWYKRVWRSGFGAGMWGMCLCNWAIVFQTNERWRSAVKNRRKVEEEEEELPTESKVAGNEEEISAQDASPAEPRPS